MRSKPANSSDGHHPQRKTRGLRAMLRRMIVGGDAPEKARRGGLRLESLEPRQMLAGDVDLLVTDADNNTLNETVPSEEDTSLFTALSDGELANDLVAFATALNDAGVQFFGSAFSAETTEQRELFEDGSDFLPFLEVTNPDGSLNALGISEDITVFPTWEFPDGSRETGVLSLEEISERSGVAIPLGDSPTFQEVGNQTVLIGSPLHVPIDVYDPNGGAQVVTITVADPSLVEATVLSGNRSIRIDLVDQEDIVFELFEQRAPRATGRVVELAEAGFYDGIIFHRVIDDFVLQAGDPTGTGSGGSTLGDFDDDFHPDLQHNRSGVLSFAKAGDDTNDSQFFITEVPTRFLDFNHSVFGQLVEGDSAREAISETATGAADRPLTDVVIETVEVFDDIENSIIQLRAIGGTGSTTATITVTDPDGNTHSETIEIGVEEDFFNTQPYLEEIDVPDSFNAGETAELQLISTDIEDDPVNFIATTINTNDVTALVDSETGLLRVSPNPGFAGTADVLVGVQPAFATNGDQDTQLLTFNFEAASTLLAPTSVDLLAATDTGSSNSDNITNAGVLTFLVDGVVSGATIEILDVDTGLVFGEGIAVGNSQTISTSNFAAFGDGTYSVVARQTFEGETSEISSSITVIYDSDAPASVASTAATTANVGIPYDGELISSEEGNGLTYALLSGPAGATINATTGFISWTPTADQTGPNNFEVTLTDVAGNVRTDSIDVNVASEPLAEIRLQLVDANGNEVTSVQVGERFFLNFIGADPRNALSRTGIFAAYADILFDPTIASPVSGTVIQFPDEISETGRSGLIGNGVIDELGAINFATAPTNLEETLLATVEFEGLSVGDVNIRSEPADNSGNDVLVFGNDNAIENEEILFGSVNLSVTPAIGQDFTLNDDTFVVDEDSGPTTLNVLDNDTIDSGSATLSIVSATQPSSGGSVSVQNGVVQFTPDPDFFGTSTFTYTATDGGGAQNTANVTVTVNNVNDPPIAVADSVTVDQNSVDNELDVLANDSFAPDPSETLTITFVSTSTAGATVTISPDGQSVLYTPAANFTGADSFTYTVSDGFLTSEGQVNVTVSPADAPPTANDDAFTLTEDDPEALFNITANDAPDETGQIFFIDSVGTPSNGGSARVSDDGTQFFYQPAADFFGVETVTYTISDTGGGIAIGTVTFTVTGVNDAPPVIDQDVQTNRGSGVLVALTLADLPTNVDGDGETLTFTNLGTPSAGGSVQVSGDNILYTPPSDEFVGTDTFTYSVDDGGGIISSGTITVTVNEFTTRTITLTGDAADIRGITLTGVNELGETIDLEATYIDAGDTGSLAQFLDVLPGDYQVEIPAVPFLIGGEEAQTLEIQSGPNDGDVNLAPEIGDLNPAFISIRDWLGSTPQQNILVALTAGADSMLNDVSPATTTIVTPVTSLSADGSEVTIMGQDTTGTNVEATIDVDNNPAVQSRGSVNGIELYRINVEADAIGFSLSPVTAAAQSALPAAAGELPIAAGVEVAADVEVAAGVEVAEPESILISNTTAEGESVAAAASTRADLFVPAASDLIGRNDAVVLQTEAGEVFVGESTIQQGDAQAPAQSVVDEAFQDVSDQLRVLASGADAVAESAQESDVLGENAVDSALTTEL